MAKALFGHKNVTEDEMNEYYCPDCGGNHPPNNNQQQQRPGDEAGDYYCEQCGGNHPPNSDNQQKVGEVVEEKCQCGGKDCTCGKYPPREQNVYPQGKDTPAIVMVNLSPGNNELPFELLIYRHMMTLEEFGDFIYRMQSALNLFQGRNNIDKVTF